MFNSKHYVPILKWKRAEQGALKFLSDEYKESITPLIQLVMPKYETHEELGDVVKKFEEQLPEFASKIIDVWGTKPLFIDVSLLFTVPLKAKSLIEISTNGNKLGSVFIPVIHLNDDQLIKAPTFQFAKDSRSGVCLRLICSDFVDTGKLHRDIADLVKSSGLEEKEIDLLIDLKETEENGDRYTKYLQLSQNIPNLLAWRTFIFASGAFPKDLSECKLDEENLIPRIDWQNWKKFIASQGLKRKPSFSDYTIQHPIYKEVTQFFHPTTSIKYALEDEWLIMKGQKQKFDKYLASAALLAKDKRFYGEDFSYGDKYISEKANHFEQYIRDPSIKGTGSTETWLRAGINHHLTVVAHQVANLP